jgi:peptidoglycan/xylan/chitin deacetylase (PgdA/CDA1 family)
MDAIRDWSGLSSNETYMSRSMREDEVLQLANGGLIEVGAHTRHHPMLPQLSFESQRDEIQSSKRDLEALLGKKIAGFSYPNGRASVDAKRLVRETGFTYACTSLHDLVRPGSDIYELTRFWHKNVDGDQFLQGLRLWMKMSSWRNRAQGS